MKDFDGKVALVTGAASGIGESIALLYAKHGAKVVVSDIDDPGGQDTVDAISKAGGEAVYVHADVSKPDDCMRLVGEALARYDRLDFACNNAGIGGEQNPVAQLSVEGWAGPSQSIFPACSTACATRSRPCSRTGAARS